MSGLVNILIDVIAWLIIHVTVSLSIDRVQPGSFDPESWLFRERRWERDGKFYEYVRIKAWKKLLPDGAAITRNGFRKKHLVALEPRYIRRFVAETCRAELIHWVILLFSPLFFLWNEWWIGMIMIAYGLIVNVPCIFTQRYNRIRFKRSYRYIVRR